MRRQRTAIQFARWTALALCLLTISSWAITLRYCIVAVVPNGPSISIYPYCLVFGWADHSVDKLMTQVEYTGSWRPVNLPWIETSLPGARFVVGIPFWLLTAILTAITFLLWRRSRSPTPPGHCQQCGYNLAGNATGRCPECGRTMDSNKSSTSTIKPNFPKQPIPVVSGADVERIVRRDFAADQYDLVLTDLNGFPVDATTENGRVHLAILRLAKGDIDKLRELVKEANGDWRDVLIWAEYPRYSTGVPRIMNETKEIQERIIAEDWRDYQDWFSQGSTEHQLRQR